MPSIYTSRLKTFQQTFDTDAFDALLILTEENRRYLSGYTGEDGQFDESAGALLIGKETAMLFTDSRFELQAKREALDFEAHVYKKGLFKLLPAILSDLGISRLGVESGRISWARLIEFQAEIETSGHAVSLVPVKGQVEKLRMRKDPEEIEIVRSALHLAESVFVNLLNDIRVGMTEKEAAWALERQLREAGAESLSFPSIVAAGPNSALPHAIPGDRSFSPGEPILFDFGVRLDGYCSDISRMVHFGPPDAAYRERYKLVLEAQQHATRGIAPGASSIDVDSMARETIASAGFGDYFGHGLGHGVGLAIHEGPRLSPLRETILSQGMVCTVEPGIYLADWGGIRLENMIVVTEDGVEVLNQTDPADMIIL